jgi:serine/threonine protein kinase
MQRFARVAISRSRLTCLSSAPHHCGSLLAIQQYFATAWAARKTKRTDKQESVACVLSALEAAHALQDLLSKILVANPEERYTIKNIIQHPWFQTDLPSRALKMNDDYLQLTPEGQGFQQLEEIKAILAEAKTKPNALRKKEDDLIVAATELQT